MHSVGPKYFNDRLNEKIEDMSFLEDQLNTPFDEGRELKLPINEWGAPTSMSVYDFLVHGEGIACHLKGRVREFLFRMELDADHLRENTDTAKALLEQFDRLKKSKEKAARVVADLREKLLSFDQNHEKLTGKHLVMHFASAQKVVTYLTGMSSKIENNYFQAGTVNTYLIDRINKLRSACHALNQVEFVTAPTENDSGEEL